MTLAQKISTARHARGLTQEQLAANANITVRTVQRIETGESVPRAFTIKAMASVLQIPLGELIVVEAPIVQAPVGVQEDPEHFLQVFCLSCFSFILIPYVHFLIPHYLLQKQEQLQPLASTFARRIIRVQIYWVVAFHLLLLLTLAANFLIGRFNQTFLVSYLWIVLFMYVVNIVVILLAVKKAKQIFN